MNYLKYTQYVYLIAAIFFIYQAYVSWQDNTDQHWLFLIIAVVSLFMFFFRRRFAKKFEDHNNKP